MVKTITNYFSPVPKPVEKPFSPPRTNNIMDYFSRKAPSSKEKTRSPEQSKENRQLAEKQTSSEVAVKQPSQKRTRKASKAVRKLVEADTVGSTAEENCLILDEPDDNRDSAEAIRSCGVFGSDPASLLVQLSAEACVTVGKEERNPTKTVSEKADHHEDASKCENNVKLQPEVKSIELSPIVPSKYKEKPVKTVARNSRKKQQQEAKHTEPEEKEIESSLCDVSMEVNVDEASQLNSSTVTVSFEEFVRSQSQDRDEDDIDEQGKENESKITTEAEEIDINQLNNLKAEENEACKEPPLQVSPRTVTIQAEVHVASPKQEAKAVGKLASMFNRRKGAMSPLEGVLSPHIEAGHKPPSTSVTAKRKSNVVLQEEDLELAVLESESTPKCSEAERKHFMAAFKQPSLDGSKNKPGKSQGKQKQQEEKVLDDANKAADEDTVIPPSVEQVPASSQENKVAKKKLARKGKKRAKEEKEAVTTPPAATTVEETVATIVEADDKREEPPVTSTPSVLVVRRSRREAVVRQAIPPTLDRKTREHDSKDVTAALPDGSPVNMSTPKIRKSKHGVFVAEMVCPPDTKQSPIR